MNSCRKGKSGELELAHELTRLGFPARRGRQFSGSPDSPDVLCPDLPGFHLEVKRVEALRLYEAVQKAQEDAGAKIPLVMHRKSRGEWLVVLRLQDFAGLVRSGSDYESAARATIGKQIGQEAQP